VRDPGGGLARVLVPALGQYRVEQDAGEEVVAAWRDRDTYLCVGGLVHLRGAADLTRAGRAGEAGPQQPDRHQLVEVERGELTGAADGRRRLVAVHRTPGATDELVHATAQVVVERGDRGDRRLGCALGVAHLVTVARKRQARWVERGGRCRRGRWVALRTE